MANIRKQFNFRNGIQVDDDNLVVDPLGKVGIGTTIPTEFLDVRGNLKVVGLATCNSIYTPSLTAETANITSIQLDSTSASIVGGGVSISSGIITASDVVGIVTYYGDGVNLLNLPTSQWLDIDVGLGFTSIYAQGFVGVNTNDPRFMFQVSGTNDTSLGGFVNGVGIGSGGDVLITGVTTSGKFVGIGSDITQLTGSNIAYGTVPVERLPQIPDGNLYPNLNLGIVTTSSIDTGNFTGVGGTFTGDLSVETNTSVGGTFGVGGNVSHEQDLLVRGSFDVTNNAGIGSFFTVGLSATVTNNLDVGGWVSIGATVSIGQTLTVNKIEVADELIGIAQSARNLIGEPDIVVGILTANSVAASSFIGGLVGDLTGTATTAINLTPTSVIDITSATAGIGSFTDIVTERVGIGSTTPLADLEIYRSGNLLIQGISTSGEARIAIGRSNTYDGWNGVLRFGVNNNPLLPYSTDYSFDIVNFADGNINSYIQAGDVGINTGSFNWIHRQQTELMTLTYEGKLGIGVTLPEHQLEVVGTSTVTTDSYVGRNLFVANDATIDNDLYVDGNLTLEGAFNFTAALTADLEGNVYAQSGVSTFASLIALDDSTIDRLGVGATLGDLSYGPGNYRFVVNDRPEFYGDSFIIDDTGRVGIGTTALEIDGINSPQRTAVFAGVGVGTDRAYTDYCAVDFTFAGRQIEGTNAYTNREYMRVPRANSTEIGNFTNLIGGEIVFNTTTNKHQGYDGSIWNDLY
jgi:cytoskeletal protein CcmA (bactofilin family)